MPTAAQDLVRVPGRSATRDCAADQHAAQSQEPQWLLRRGWITRRWLPGARPRCGRGLRERRPRGASTPPFARQPPVEMASRTISVRRSSAQLVVHDAAHVGCGRAGRPGGPQDSGTVLIKSHGVLPSPALTPQTLAASRAAASDLLASLTTIAPSATVGADAGAARQRPVTARPRVRQSRPGAVGFLLWRQAVQVEHCVRRRRTHVPIGERFRGFSVVADTLVRPGESSGQGNSQVVQRSEGLRLIEQADGAKTSSCTWPNSRPAWVRCLRQAVEFEVQQAQKARGRQREAV